MIIFSVHDGIIVRTSQVRLFSHLFLLIFFFRYKTGDELEIVGLVTVGKKLIVSAKPLFLEYVKNKVTNQCTLVLFEAHRNSFIPGAVLYMHPANYLHFCCILQSCTSNAICFAYR